MGELMFRLCEFLGIYGICIERSLGHDTVRDFERFL